MCVRERRGLSTINRCGEGEREQERETEKHPGRDRGRRQQEEEGINSTDRRHVKPSRAMHLVLAWNKSQEVFYQNPERAGSDTHSPASSELQPTVRQGGAARDGYLEERCPCPYRHPPSQPAQLSRAVHLVWAWNPRARSVLLARPIPLINMWIIGSH